MAVGYNIFNNDDFLRALRTTFEDAYNQISSRNNTKGRSKNEIFDSLVFADDNEQPKAVSFVPFTWNERGANGSGYLMRDLSTGKVYGLQTADGLSMNAKGAKNYLKTLLDDNQSGFSDPGNTTNYAFGNNDETTRKLKGASTSYLMSRGSPYGKVVDTMLTDDNLVNNPSLITDFVRLLRKTYESGDSEEARMQKLLDYVDSNFSKESRPQQIQSQMQVSKTQNTAKPYGIFNTGFIKQLRRNGSANA